jgi:hypothetical protein
MAGEISPNIMFCKTKAKWTQTALNGWSGVSMGVMECICMGEQETKEKRGKIGDQYQFCRCDHGKQNITKLTRMAERVREDAGGKLWQTNGFAVRYNVHMQAKWKKIKQQCQKKWKRARTNLCNPMIYKAKKTRRKRAKKS